MLGVHTDVLASLWKYLACEWTQHDNLDWNVAEFSSNVRALSHLNRVSMNRYSHHHCKTMWTNLVTSQQIASEIYLLQEPNARHQKKAPWFQFPTAPSLVTNSIGPGGVYMFCIQYLSWKLCNRGFYYMSFVCVYYCQKYLSVGYFTTEPNVIACTCL